MRTKTIIATDNLLKDSSLRCLRQEESKIDRKHENPTRDQDEQSLGGPGASRLGAIVVGQQRLDLIVTDHRRGIDDHVRGC